MEEHCLFYVVAFSAYSAYMASKTPHSGPRDFPGGFPRAPLECIPGLPDGPRLPRLASKIDRGALRGPSGEPEGGGSLGDEFIEFIRFTNSCKERIEIESE